VVYAARMTSSSPVSARPARAGALVAVALAAVGALFTLLLLAAASYALAFFAADHELYGSAWLIVGWLAVLGVTSGVAAAYLGRRGLRNLRRP
jgi:cell division protein FtsX